MPNPVSAPRVRVPISLSPDTFRMLEEMRSSCSLSRSTIVELALRSFYSSDSAQKFQIRDRKSASSGSVRRRGET